MSEALFSPLVERALRVAARAHRHQTRKASDLPYLSHPAGVAIILSQAGFRDEHVLAAALLHDVVEDTDYPPDRLAAEFPPRVVEYVLALTEHKRDAAGRPRSWQDRKRDHLVQVRAVSLEARAIALADKLHNLASIAYDLQEHPGDTFWDRFNASPAELLSHFHSLIAAAAGDDPRLAPLADACRSVLSRIEAQIVTK